MANVGTWPVREDGMRMLNAWLVPDGQGREWCVTIIAEVEGGRIVRTSRAHVEVKEQCSAAKKRPGARLPAEYEPG